MYLNRHLKFEKKGRYASCDRQTLLTALEKAIKKGLWPGETVDDWIEYPFDRIDLSKDLSVTVDLENYSFGWEHPEFEAPFDPDYNIEEIIIDGKSVPVIPILAGADYQLPVAILVYADNKGTLRAYVPKPGNVFNTLNKSAFGEDYDKDNQYVSKYIAREAAIDEVSDDFDYDVDLMTEAVRARLIPC